MIKIIVKKNISIGDVSKELAEELCRQYGSNVAGFIVQFAVAEIEMIKRKEIRKKE